MSNEATERQCAPEDEGWDIIIARHQSNLAIARVLAERFDAISASQRNSLTRQDALNVIAQFRHILLQKFAAQVDIERVAGDLVQAVHDRLQEEAVGGTQQYGFILTAVCDALAKDAQ